MRLEELIFCTVFFIVPILGMFGLVIGRVLRGEREEVSNHKVKKQIHSLKKAKHAAGGWLFAKDRVMAYQLIESQVHMPLQLSRFKEKAHPRAGP
ncbi:MAG: hypothetical protein E7231_08450 [Cellulosilyticum sp.]|nr:hypothetical protein [Cellulosilyticum sp.]